MAPLKELGKLKSSVLEAISYNIPNMDEYFTNKVNRDYNEFINTHKTGSKSIEKYRDDLLKLKGELERTSKIYNMYK